MSALLCCAALHEGVGAEVKALGRCLHPRQSHPKMFSLPPSSCNHIRRKSLGSYLSGECADLAPPHQENGILGLTHWANPLIRTSDQFSKGCSVYILDG